MKYSVLCKPLYEEDKTLSPDVWMTRLRRFIRREGTRRRRGGSKGDDGGGNGDVREGEEREGAASLEVVSNDDGIYGDIASGQGNTTTNAKAAKDDDGEEGCMVGIPQFWVCAMVY